MDDLSYRAEDDPFGVSGIANNAIRKLGIEIVSGRYRPGDRLLTEIEGAGSLGISRASYREAVRVLTEKGLLNSRPRAGTSVNAITAWNHTDPELIEWTFLSTPPREYFDGVFEFRMSIEPEAARLAASRRSVEQMGVLKRCLNEMREQPYTSDIGRNAKGRFYRTVFEATHNLMMSSIGSAIATTAELCLPPKTCFCQTQADLLGDHYRLLSAIDRQDGEAARVASIALILSTHEYVRHVLFEHAVQN